MIKRHTNPRLEDLKDQKTATTHDLLVQLEKVSGIFKKIEEDGDHSVQNFADLIGNNPNYKGAIPTSEWIELCEQIEKEQKAAIDYVASNIELFHSTQHRYEAPSQPVEGLTVWRKSIPFHSVGILVNGGDQPDITKMLSLAIPAKLAGCTRIVVFVSSTTALLPTLAYAANVAGVTEIHLLDHTVAIAASTVGTEAIPRMDKILGGDIGDQIMAAKRLANLAGVPVDYSNAPSSFFILFDNSVAIETIESEVLSALLENKQKVIVFSTLSKEMNDLDERLSSNNALKQNDLINLHLSIVPTIDDAFKWCHQLSPSELWLAIEDATYHAKSIRNVANVFVGADSLKSVGQYVSGPNTVVPSAGLSRCFQAIGLNTFIRKTTFQEMDKAAKAKMAKAAIYVGRMENKKNTISAIQKAKK